MTERPNYRRYVGKNIVVTGAADGLGRALALGFAREGGHLIVTDIAAEGLHETVRLIVDGGGTAEAHVFDVADEAAIKAFADAIGQHHDGIDVLYNNAGIAYGLISDFRKVVELDQADWMRFLAVNTVAPALFSKAFRPLLKARKGNIINQSSMSSTDPTMAYGITKSALNGVTRAFAGPFGADGIRVNAIAPGLIETTASQTQMTQGLRDYVAGTLMIKKRGLPGDIVSLALFLGSEDASFITCEVLSCDGGSNIRQWRY